VWQQIEPSHRSAVYWPPIRYSLDPVSEIVQRFARIALEQPDRPVIYVAGTNDVLTASQVWRVHLELRQRLSAIGVGPDQLVVSAAGNRPASIPLLLACLALRAPLMPVDAGAAIAEIAEIATRFGASAIVLPEASVRSSARTSLPLVGDLHVVHHRVDGTMYGDAAVLKLTSGSTGFPKATLTAETHLISDGEHIIEAMGIRGDDIQIAAIPLSHSYGFGSLIMPLVLQGTALVLRESFVPQQLLFDARRFHTRVFPGVPYQFNYFVENPPPEGWPSCLQLLISAGARLDVQTIDAFHTQFGRKIHSFYGTSETGGIAYDAGDAVNPDAHVGNPMPGVAVTVRADEGAPAGSGRIFVQSPSIASGYLHAGAHQEDPFDQEDPFVDGGFLTGDFGFVDVHGSLALTGRASAAVNVAGRKVHPAEIERVLRGMEGVEDACVIAAPDARRGQQIVACVISRRNLTALDVRQFCAARLAAYKLPRAIIFLPSLPTTARGKTDHATLLALALEQLERSV
jgi:acyl-CoA synthetase (AMP-forming)/AMP-acid ligase II